MNELITMKVGEIGDNMLKPFINNLIVESLMCVVQNMPESILEFTVNRTMEFVQNKYKFERLASVKTAIDLGNEGALRIKGNKLSFQVIAGWLTEYREMIQKRNVIEINKSEAQFIEQSQDFFKSHEYARAILFRHLNYSQLQKENEAIEETVSRMKQGILKLPVYEKGQKWN